MRNPSQKFLEAEGPGVSESTHAPGGAAPSPVTGPQAQAIWLCHRSLRFFERVRSNEPKSSGFVSTPPGLNFRSCPPPYPRYPRANLRLCSCWTSSLSPAWGAGVIRSSSQAESCKELQKEEQSWLCAWGYEARKAERGAPRRSLAPLTG